MSGESREEVGPYLVYEQLGAGGMATVHRAEQRGIAGFRRVVALKRLHANVAADPELLRSFIHEARLASHLKHTNVAQTFDLGKVGETYFIAMEFVPGPTLAQLMRQCAQAAGPIPLAIVLSILIQICDALDHAHNLCDELGQPLGIIHRDVSPSNVIVSNSGTVKLIDFGIAKASNSDVRTQTGMIKGKFGYIAPEYLKGQLDPRGDLFGVGVIAHELLTGRSLFLGRNDFDTLSRVREMPIPPPSRSNASVTSDLEDIVMTALQRDPELRWQSAAAMRTALHNVMRDLGLVISNQQVFEWVEWAFSQVPRGEPAELRRAIDGLDEPSLLFDARSPIAPAPAPAPLPSSAAPGASPPAGFAPDSLADTQSPPTSPGFAPGVRRRSKQIAARPLESLPTTPFEPATPPAALPPETLPPSAFETPPETLPPSAFPPVTSPRPPRPRASRQVAAVPEPPETLPASAFGADTLETASPSETMPSLPQVHLPPAPPVDPAAKLAAAKLAPALPAPVSAPKLVSAPQSPSRAKAASTPPVMVARDKPPSVPPRDRPPSIPPPVRDKPPSVPPAPVAREKSASVPPPPPVAREKPASVPPPAPVAREKPASVPPPPPRPTGPRPVAPVADSLGATEPHLPRYHAIDEGGTADATAPRELDPFAATSPAPRISLDETDPVARPSRPSHHSLDATDPVPRESLPAFSRDSVPSFSRPSATLEDGGATPEADTPDRRSLTELAGLRPPRSAGAARASSRALASTASAASAASAAPASSTSSLSAAPPASSASSRSAAASSRSAASAASSRSAASSDASAASPARPAKKTTRASAEKEDPHARGGRWWLVLLLMLLAAFGAAAAAYYFGYAIAL